MKLAWGRFRAWWMIVGIGLLYLLLPTWSRYFGKIADKAVKEYKEAFR